jgi:hypothetical protein
VERFRPATLRRFLAACLSTTAIAGANAQSIEVLDFRFVEPKGRPGHQGLFPIDGEPLLGQRLLARARLSDAVSELRMRLLGEDGVELGSSNLIRAGHPLAARIDYVGEIDIPAVPFQIHLSGVDASGRPFAVPGGSASPQPIEVHLRMSTGQLRHGVNRLTGTLLNHGSSDTFMLATATDASLASTITPPSLVVATNETKQFYVEIEVAPHIPPLTQISLTASATSSTVAAIRNEAGTTLVVVPLELEGTPMGIAIDHVLVLLGQNGLARVRGTYTLGPGSDDFDAVKEPVTVTLGMMPSTVTPGSFQRLGQMFKFKQDDVRGVVRMKLKRATFDVVLENLDFAQLDFGRPITFGLSIGNDVGEVAISRTAGYPFLIRPDEDGSQSRLEKLEAERD